MASSNNISNEEREKLFGKFKWTRGNGDSIDIEDGWESKNIVDVYVPQLKGIKTDGGKCNGHIKWNVHCVNQILAAFAEIQQLGVLGDILTYDGAFNARVKRNGSTPSNHAYGTAIDLNCQWNWLGDTPAKPGQYGSLHRVAPCFKTHGFGWGGEWTSPKDGMHFEVLRIVNYDAPDTDEVEKDGVPKGPLLIIGDDWKKALPLTIVNGTSTVSGKGLFELAGEKWEGSDKQVPAGQTLVSLGYWYDWKNDVKKLYAYKR